MRKLLMKYPSNGRRETLVPWALDEPEAPLSTESEHRRFVFGDTKLALLYSGSFGHAHSYKEILDLAESIASEQVRIALSLSGNRKRDLEEVVRQRKLDIRFVPFAKTSELRTRLACADVHIVTLREEWTGMVVPSKFFGALAAGRPILFAGSANSSLAEWIRKFEIGWILNSENIDQVRTELLEYADSPKLQAEMRMRCFTTYRQHFSKNIQVDSWNTLLRLLSSDTAAMKSN